MPLHFYFLYLPIMKAYEKNQSWEERRIAEARRAASVLERKIKLLSKSPGMPPPKLAVGKAGGYATQPGKPKLPAVGAKPLPIGGRVKKLLKPRGSAGDSLPIGQGAKRKQEGGLVFRINLFRECGLVLRINLFRKCVV